MQHLSPLLFGAATGSVPRPRATALAALAATLLAFGAEGGTFSLVADDVQNKSGFTSAASWIDESGAAATFAPNAASGAESDYVVTNGFVLRTPTGSAAFGGKSLTVGSSDSAGHVYVKGSSQSYPNGLTLVKGSYRCDNTATYSISGGITVLSTEESPFWFGRDDDSEAGRGFSATIGAAFSGGSTAAFAIGGVGGSKPFSGFTFVLSGDNSAYLGKILARGDTSPTLVANSPTALGGARASFLADAVKLTTKNTATLRFTANAGSSLATGNLGITFDGIAGGSVTTRAFVLDAESDFELAVPVAAYGQTSNHGKRLELKKAGAGTLTWSGEITFPDGLPAGYPKLAVEAGRLVLGSASTIALTNELSDAVWVKSPSATETTLSGWTLSAGGGFAFAEGNGAIALATDCTLAAGALPIHVVYSANDATAAQDVSLLEIPVSLGTVTAADFVDDGNADSTFRVETENGVQTVSLVRQAKTTLAWVDFDEDMASHAFAGTLDGPTLTTHGGTPEISSDVWRVGAVGEYGDASAVFRGKNAGSLSVNRGTVGYLKARELVKHDSQTIEFFFKSGPHTRYQNIFKLSVGQAQTDTVIWAFLFDGRSDGGTVTEANSNDKIKMSFSFRKSDGTLANSSNPIAAQTAADGNWHHIAYTFKPNASDEWKTDVEMFVDYVSKGRATATGKVNLDPGADDCSLWISAVTDGRSLYFNGCIDELRISKGVLPVSKFLRQNQPAATVIAFR